MKVSTIINKKNKKALTLLPFLPFYYLSVIPISVLIIPTYYISKNILLSSILSLLITVFCWFLIYKKIEKIQIIKNTWYFDSDKFIFGNKRIVINVNNVKTINLGVKYLDNKRYNFAKKIMPEIINNYKNMLVIFLKINGVVIIPLYIYENIEEIKNYLNINFKSLFKNDFEYYNEKIYNFNGPIINKIISI